MKIRVTTEQVGRNRGFETDLVDAGLQAGPYLQNHHFISRKNLHFLVKTLHSLVKNLHFLVKNTHFSYKN